MKRYPKETDPFYTSAAWRNARKLALMRDRGLCVRCLAAGRAALDRAGRAIPVQADLVHHKQPIRQAPELALCLDNLESLCCACHEEMHPERHGSENPRETAAQRMGIRIERL